MADYGLLRDATTDGALLVSDRCAPTAGATGGGPSRVVAGLDRDVRGGEGPRGSLLATGTGNPAYLSTAGWSARPPSRSATPCSSRPGCAASATTASRAPAAWPCCPAWGASLVRPLGTGATIKLRTAYGSGLRPARTAARATSVRGVGAVGADLAPERQRGVEGGADLYLQALGGRPAAPVVALHVTAFRQQATDLVQQVLTVPLTPWTPPRTALDSSRRTPATSGVRARERGRDRQPGTRTRRRRAGRPAHAGGHLRPRGQPRAPPGGRLHRRSAAR
jgi:hypothetical protein